MKILLIEDDEMHCREYREAAGYLPYTVNLSVADGCSQGIELTLAIRPDIILLDLELHKGDRDGLMFLSDLRKHRMDIVPYIIVITHNTSKKTYNAARKHGADYIFPKGKQDYCPRLVYDFCYDYYGDLPNDAHKPDSELESMIAHEMDNIGITYGMGGRSYITEAVILIIRLYPDDTNASTINMEKHVYPVIAKTHKKSIGSIEQGIKNAIVKAWTINDIDTLLENYTVRVSYRTGYPSNKDFIFYYVDKLKGKTGHG